MKTKFYIGTSGWQHKEMKGLFYPKDLPIDEWLDFYIKHFQTVEINTSFYHMKLKKAYRKWVKRTPDDFLFAAKLFRYLTHIRRLRLDKESIPILRDNISNLSVLGEKLGPVLIQLPPTMKIDLERLQIFIEKLMSLSSKIFKKEQPLYSIEFRHISWLEKEVYSLLRKNKIAFCISDSPNWPTAKVLTTDWTYIRFHGKPDLFASPYTRSTLKVWLKDILELHPKRIFGYFNNTSKSNAAANAKTLIKLASEMNDKVIQ